MTSTPCASAALACLIAPWVVMIVAVLRAIVEPVLAMAKDGRSILPGCGARCWMAGRSSPVRSLACKCSREFVRMDLRALACRAQHRFMAKLATPELNDDIGSERRICPHVKSARGSCRSFAG
jgi:hypothetical protein